MKHIIRGAWATGFAGLLALVWSVSVSSASAALPAEVSEALAGAECTVLSELNRHYWSQPQSASRSAAIAALEDAILALPDCGETRVELLRAEPVRGVDVFDHRRPPGRRGR